MNNRRAVSFQGIDQLPGRPFLMPPGEGKDHAPVTALKIALPRATTSRLEQSLPRAAEPEQVCIAWENNALIFRQLAPWAYGQNAPDQFLISLLVRDGQIRIKAGMVEKL